ncbi:hypothetical protein BX616_000669, partial [Lobosporangium transversale]
TVWTAGVPNFVSWSGNCASMGGAAKNVTVILNTGPSEAVRYVATLGSLDCSGTITRTDLTVPLDIPSGSYSIVVRTDPQLSYTNIFKINNPSSPEEADPGVNVASADATAAGDSTPSHPENSTKNIATGGKTNAGAFMLMSLSALATATCHFLM